MKGIVKTLALALTLALLCTGFVFGGEVDPIEMEHQMWLSSIEDRSQAITDLREAVEEANALKEEEYTAESFAALKAALRAVDEMPSEPDLQMLEDLLKQLEDAVAGLVKKTDGTGETGETETTGETGPGDRSELDYLIGKAEALVEEDYTPESYARVKEALEAAAAMPEDADQEAIDSLAKAVDDAMDSLEKKGSEIPAAGKDDLIRIIEQAKALKEEGYTPESYANLIKALEKAEALPEDADQEAVDAAAKALSTAIAALKEIPKVDTSRLEEAIDKAEKLEKDKYTEDSLALLDLVLSGAKTALSSDDQDEVDKALQTLNKFLEGLEERSPIPFTDVVKDDYFYDAVVWAFTADPQVTDGTSETTFSPKNTCTRAQVVTFLWRAQGCPEPETKANPFTDVAESDWFYKPVLWAVEKGITDGTSPTTFSPKSTCKNSHILTFIYRAVGEPNKTGQGSWWSDAFNWANFGGLLTGSYSGEYDVNAECPRANVVYYLHQMNK